VILECSVHRRQWVALHCADKCPWCERDAIRNRIKIFCVGCPKREDEVAAAERDWGNHYKHEPPECHFGDSSDLD
jgi:hypothetical protein